MFSPEQLAAAAREELRKTPTMVMRDAEIRRLEHRLRALDEGTAVPNATVETGVDRLLNLTPEGRAILIERRRLASGG